MLHGYSHVPFLCLYSLLKYAFTVCLMSGYLYVSVSRLNILVFLVSVNVSTGLYRNQYLVFLIQRCFVFRFFLNVFKVLSYIFLRL